MESDKMPCIFYADIESFIREIDGKKPSTMKIGEHIPSGYSMSENRGFIIQNTSILYVVEKTV